MANYIDNIGLSQTLTYLKKYIDDIATTKQSKLNRTIWGAHDTGTDISGNMFMGDSKKVGNYLEYLNGNINLQGNIFITGGNAATKDYVNNQVNWKIVTDATDLNTMTTTGKYLMEGTLTNTPTSAWAYLIVENAAIGRITQTIWHDTDATNQYTRQLYNTVWGGWVKIANSGDIPTKLSQLTNDIHANVDGVSYGTLKIYPSDQITVAGSDDGAITPKGVNKYVSANYLSLSGGTLTGVIKSNFASNTWINGVTNACLTCNYAGYGAIFNAPVKDGRISLSTYPVYDNFLCFGFATTAQITAGTNSFNRQIVFDMANSAITATTFKGILSGNADTSTYPLGFTGSTSSWSWGHLTTANGYSQIRDWIDGLGGYIAFADNGGQLSVQTDGAFWQREGQYMCLDSGNYSSYAPTLTGTGASGTWGINISGSAKNVISYGDQVVNTGNRITNGPGTGLFTYGYYNSGGPTSYGEIISFGKGSGGHSEIAVSWSGTPYMYIRSLRDNTDNWTAWRQVACVDSNVATATVASKLGKSGNSGAPMTFNWSGQSGQPSWLWGGNDGTNMYVYNPSNFNVNHANSAGNADKLGGFTESSFLRERGNWADGANARAGLSATCWYSSQVNYQTGYGDSLHIQGTNTWYNRLDFGTNGRIYFYQAINPSTLTKCMQYKGALAYLSDTVAAATKVSTTIPAGQVNDLVYANIADNDYFRIHAGGGSDNGWAEIATADDGTEPIYVRQYTGVFASIVRTLTLLDENGNTTIPGSLNVSGNTNITGVLSVNGSCYVTSHVGKGTWMNGLSFCRITTSVGGDLGSGNLGWVHDGQTYIPNMVITMAASDITIYIPSDMPDGFILIVRNAGAGTVNIRTRSTYDKFQWGNYSGGSYWSYAPIPSGVLDIIVYDKSTRTWYAHGIK